MDSKRAQNVIDFINTLTAPDGKGAGLPLVLRDWQEDIIRSVYAPQDDLGRRQKKQAVLSMGRKNGKTALVAGLCMAHLCGPEAIRNGQLYSVAYDRDQASIIFRYMVAMIRADEELEARLNIRDSVKEIVDPVSGSMYKALSSESKSKHGKSSSFLAFDELAQFGSERQLYDVMMTSTGAHDESLAWVFSTQAASDQALLSELIDYGNKINRDEIQDNTFACFVYEVPEPKEEETESGYDPAWDEEKWKLANPALGDFRSLDEMRNFSTKARAMPTAEAAFRNLYCNQRISSEQHFLTPQAWKGCGQKPDTTALEHGRIYAGLDLSGKNDLTSLVLDAVDQSEHNIFAYFWTPGDNIRDRSDRDRVPYVTWRDQGYIEAKSGKTIDYRYVAQQTARIHSEHGIYELRFDRWRIEDFQRELNDIGIDTYIKGKEEPPSGEALCLVPHGQGYKDINSAVEAVEDAVTEGRVRHGNNPVLTMCASNVVVQEDPAGSRKFAKDKSTGRIDGIVAMAMAMNGAELPQVEEGTSVYESRGLLTV